MRQIVLDTETTGLDCTLGHRVIEIAAVELVNRHITGNHFHRYINPERDCDAGALQVHGLTNEFLQDKPKFRDIAAELLDFLRGGELIIHNAAFDVGFLNAELALAGLDAIEPEVAEITDTLKLAKELHPGKKNSLDVLCERYRVDNSARTLHGALLDARLLADVYLAMTRGQESLAMDLQHSITWQGAAITERISLIVLRATDDELLEHGRILDDIDQVSRGRCVWKALEAPRTM